MTSKTRAIIEMNTLLAHANRLELPEAGIYQQLLEELLDGKELQMQRVLDTIAGQHAHVVLTEDQVNTALAAGLIYECPACSGAYEETPTTAYHTTLDSDEANWDEFVARITAERN